MLVLQSYCHELRYQRKLVSHNFTSSNVPRYYGLQEVAAQRFVLSVIEKPDLLETNTKL